MKIGRDHQNIQKKAKENGPVIPVPPFTVAPLKFRNG